MLDSFFDPFLRMQSDESLKLFYEIDKLMSSWKAREEGSVRLDEILVIKDIMAGLEKNGSEPVKKAIRICGDAETFAAVVFLSIREIYNKGIRVYSPEIADAMIGHCAHELVEKFGDRLEKEERGGKETERQRQPLSPAEQEKMQEPPQKKVLVSGILDALAVACPLPEAEQALRIAGKKGVVENAERFLEKIAPGKEIVDIDDISKAILYAVQDIASRGRM